MALDRQKILNELGSVVNQLQSANCGCMENVFGQNAQNPGYNMGYHGHPQSTCGGHQHSCNRVCGSTAHPGGFGCQPSEVHANQSHCRGTRKPPQLYADTYNYLNHNLIQPSVKEAYDELKTITPDNTVVNNPALAKQMGLPFANLQGNPPQNISGPNYTNETYKGHASMPSNPLPNTMQGGMGPTIMNMMTSNPSEQARAMPSGTNNALSHSITNNSIPNKSFPGHNQSAIPSMPPHITKNNINPNNTSAQSPYFGKHAQSLSKFNEMFPEVMGQGDLGFNPMAIAIQMNPENQKQSAYNSMPKVNNVNNAPIVNTLQQSNLQPIAGDPNSLPLTDTSLYLNQVTPMQHVQKDLSLPNQDNIRSAYPTNQQIYPSMPMQDAIPEQRKILEQTLTSQALPSYTSAKPSPSSAAYGGLNEIQPVAHLTTQPALNNQFVKQKVYPAIVCPSLTATQNRKPLEYNTLGQPIEMVPAKIFHTPEPPLPQTLSPQIIPLKSNDPARYSNVKSTESKTSLMGNKSLGKTQSRSQLQRVYNEYRASQSLTQQNIKPFNMTTHSDGKLNVPQSHANSPQNLVIEQKCGDTALNNMTKAKIEVVGQIGDVPPSNKANIGKLSPIAEGKCRNGLQDMVYTSYSLAPAWSFHG